MRPTLDTRKPIDALKEVDIETFPIWEFCIDEEEVEGQDETWVKPVDATLVEAGLYSLSVAADFRTASGRELVGIVSVTTADEVGIYQTGALIIDGQYLYIASADRSFSGQARERVAKALGASVNTVFPLEFTLRVPLEGESATRSGRID